MNINKLKDSIIKTLQGKKMNKWKDIIIDSVRTHVDINTTIESYLIQEALSNNSGEVANVIYYDGFFHCGKEKVIEKITDAGFRAVKRYWSKEQIINTVFVSDFGAIALGTRGKNFAINLVCNDINIFNKLNKFIVDNISYEVDSDNVYVISSGMGRLKLTEIGIAGQKLERDNYDEKVLKSFDKVIQDLNSSAPTGRISILEGPPGTGKTFLIKGILHDAPDAVCIMVPSNMISELSGPSLIPVLMEAKSLSGADSAPIILILEDADVALKDREKTDLSTISTLLNLGDGIIGGLLDLRIIATTNASELDMDKAIIRSGRLSQRITVGEIAAKHANKILSKLLNKKTSKFRQKVILADVYKEAKEQGWIPSSSNS